MANKTLMLRALAGGLLGGLLGQDAVAGEWFGRVAAQGRYFPHEGLSAGQFDGLQASFSVEPEYTHDWDGGRQVFTFAGFARADSEDDDRTHADIRELSWIKAAEDWELRVGISRVFWGVTEFLHLVDVINQTDLVENPDGEDKLGQPMINLALIRDWGTVDLFVLPGFRERTFPGREGRPGIGLPVDTDDPIYESDREEQHVDFALRWSHRIGGWDVGLAHFYGTGRDPRFEPALDDNGRPVLRPVYEIINQTSLDLQYTTEAWLWKLEWLTRDGQGDRYTAATGGFEYTLVGVFGSDADLGLIAEYAWDERGDDAPTPFENDLVIGARLALNDEQSSELLAGVVFDMDSSARYYSLEASRRVGDEFKLSLEARASDDLPSDDNAYPARNEDYVQLELAWYF